MTLSSFSALILLVKVKSKVLKNPAIFGGMSTVSVCSWLCMVMCVCTSVCESVFLSYTRGHIFSLSPIDHILAVISGE